MAQVTEFPCLILLSVLFCCSWQYRSLDHDIGFGVFFTEKDKKNSKAVEEMVLIYVFLISL